MPNMSEETGQSLLEAFNNKKIGDLHEKVNATNIKLAAMEVCLSSLKKDVEKIASRTHSPDPACILRENEKVDAMKKEVQECVDEIAESIFGETRKEIQDSWKRTMWALGIILGIIMTLAGWCVFLNYQVGESKGQNAQIIRQLDNMGEKLDKVIQEGEK